MLEGLTKNGNAEKCYLKYYATIALHAAKYFPGLSHNSATQLSTKLTDQLQAHSKEVQLSLNPADAEVEKSLQEKEIAALQYLGCMSCKSYTINTEHLKTGKHQKVNRQFQHERLVKKKAKMLWNQRN